jgi:H+/Cl- antiporter ClcA
VSKNGPRMPPRTTVVHDLLQIVTVALGSPLGREVAPRELGAVFATLLCERARLSQASSRILVACGAGAGLAAVYNVPLGGALFTIEVLLGSWAPSAVLPAMATSAIATIVAWIGLGNARPYSLPPLGSSLSLIVWSVAAGPVMGIAAYWFVQLTDLARRNAPKGCGLFFWCIGVFSGIGFLSLFYPQLLGNGRTIAHLSFDSDLTLRMAGVLLVLRMLILTGALRSGAHGGLLTPGLSMGALLGTIGGILWNYRWPSTPVGAFAIVGAIAFLAASMKMPLTAVVLGIEFRGIGHDFFVSIIIAVVGAVSVSHLWLSGPEDTPARTHFARRVIPFNRGRLSGPIC